FASYLERPGVRRYAERVLQEATRWTSEEAVLEVLERDLDAVAAVKALDTTDWKARPLPSALRGNSYVKHERQQDRERESERERTGVPSLSHHNGAEKGKRRKWGDPVAAGLPLQAPAKQPTVGKYGAAPTPKQQAAVAKAAATKLQKQQLKEN
ncbi:unnamed protein product, partial [Phaeothamnion confervicola]